MKVIIGCEESGIIQQEFEKKGHDAWSCDLQPSKGSKKHIQDDVRNHLEGWDLGIFHPPCTRLCNSGVRWLSERNLWPDLQDACLFFLELLNSPIERIAVENPLPHKYAREIIGRYHQKIQPWMFGDPYSKATCLWLKNLPPLMATRIETRRTQKCFLESPGPNRSRHRSQTYPGIARAMAEQWG